MRWEGRANKRSGVSGYFNSRLSFSSRIILGSLAIALIALAFVLRPSSLPQDSSRATPPAQPTYVAAAVAGLPAVAPTAPATLIPTAVPSEQIYTVKSGDTLSSIAKQYYGDASKWQKIMDANNDVLKSPSSLQLGQKLKIPE